MPIRTLTGERTFVSRHPLDLTKCTKTEILEYFENSYDLYESLFSTLNDETVIYLVPDKLRLPLIFYYAHTAVVFVNKLVLAGLIKERINFEYDKLFEAGVNEMSWDHTDKKRVGGARITWPSLEKARDYRMQVRQAVMDIIRETPLSLPITKDSPWWAVMMGMEHERVHFETSSVLIRQLPVTMVTRPDEWNYAPLKTAAPRANKMLKMDQTEVTIGKPREFPSYGWDSEYGTSTRIVPAFEASEFLVTNAEFLDFVQDGGYNRKEFWTEEGWNWRLGRGLTHPMFWVCDKECKSGCGGELMTYSHCVRREDACNGINGHSNGCTTTYRYRAMFDDVDMPWAWPVDVNYHEAKAFCTWKGSDFRLILEAEHNVIRGQQTTMDVSSDPIFNTNTPQFNLNLQFASSSPVNAYPANEHGFHDVMGNVWQWTEDHYNGLCEDIEPLYVDYSITSYDGNHNILLCGSWVSSGTYASRFCRNGFRRHFLQHAGFRLARSVNTQRGNQVALPASFIETEVFVLGTGEKGNATRCPAHLPRGRPMKVRTTNRQFDYETRQALKDVVIQDFGEQRSVSAVVAEYCAQMAQVHDLSTRSAVWLGVGAGRGPLELSVTFEKVLGIDMVARFIDAAARLQRDGILTNSDGAGDQVITDLQSNWRPQVVTFKQFSWIPLEVGRDFDLTVVTFLDRIQGPKAWLLRLAEITNKSGRIVIVTPSKKDVVIQIEQIFKQKGLKCTAVEELAYGAGDGDQSVQVTLWRHS